MNAWDQHRIEATRRHNNRNTLFVWVMAILVILIGLLAWADYNTTETFTGEVTGKVVKRAYKQSDKYLLFIALDDGTIRTVELSDSVIINRWTSSDDYGAIEEGNTYSFKTRGMRIPIASQYPNVEKYDYVKGHFE